MSSFRRFRRITYLYRTPEKEELWRKAVGNPLNSFLDKNRVRKSEKKGEQEDDNDHFLTRDTKQIEPLFVASVGRSSDCVNRTHKKMPCYCQVELIWYAKHSLMLVWDVDDLESLRLPHKESDIAIFCGKHYLPVHCIVSNPVAFREKTVPSAESFKRLDLTECLSLKETFSIFLDVDSHTRDSWDRSSHHPRLGARMLDFIHQVARQHHERYEEAYAPYQLNFDCYWSSCFF